MSTTTTATKSFLVGREELLAALKNLKRVTASRGALPVLSGVKAEMRDGLLHLTATDLELTYTTSVPAVGDDTLFVAAAVRLLVAAEGANPGLIQFTVDDATVRIDDTVFAQSERLMPVEEYPRVEELTGPSVVYEDVDRLLDAFDRSLAAASGDDSRPILTGVLCANEDDHLRLVSTDSYRLAVDDTGLPAFPHYQGDGVVRVVQDDDGWWVERRKSDDTWQRDPYARVAHGSRESAAKEAWPQALVPGRALGEAIRFFRGAESLKVVTGAREASFSDGTSTLKTRLIEGEFPNYKGLIPASQPGKLIASRETFTRAMERVSKTALEASPVRIRMHGGKVELVAITQDVGEARETLPGATYDGCDTMEIAFNPFYFLDGLRIMDGDEVTLGFTDAQKPAVLRGAGTAMYLLMPVRVN